MPRDITTTLSDADLAVIDAARGEVSVADWCAEQLGEVVSGYRQIQRRGVAAELADSFDKADDATKDAVRTALKLTTKED